MMRLNVGQLKTLSEQINHDESANPTGQMLTPCHMRDLSAQVLLRAMLSASLRQGWVIFGFRVVCYLGMKVVLVTEFV